MQTADRTLPIVRAMKLRHQVGALRRSTSAVLPAGLIFAAVACQAAHPPLTPTSAASATPIAASPNPSATAKPRTIDRSRLPVHLQIPGAPSSVPASPVSADESQFGAYLDVVDLASGSARPLGQLPLSPQPMAYDLPVLSAGRGSIAYITGNPSEIVIIDVATGRQQAFVLPAVPRAIAWGPDATRVAVTTERQLLLLDTITGSAREILATAMPTGLGDLAWSPDGKWIAFADGFDLALVRPDGSDRLTGPRYYGGPQRFSWSPDSTKFTFDALPPGSAQSSPDLFLSDLSLNARDIASVANTATWSSAGERIVFEHADLQRTYVQVIDADGTNQRTIATYTGGGSIAFVQLWSPDGSLVAYATRNGIYLVSPTTGEDVTAVQGPGAFSLTNGRGVACDTLVAGWASDTRLVTLTQCEGTE